MGQAATQTVLGAFWLGDLHVQAAVDTPAPAGDVRGGFGRVGDQLLVQVGALLREHLRPQDLLARLGGDESALLLEDVGNDQAAAVALNLRAALAKMFTLRDIALHSSVSIGIAMFPAAGPELSALMRQPTSRCTRPRPQVTASTSMETAMTATVPHGCRPRPATGPGFIMRCGQRGVSDWHPDSINSATLALVADKTADGTAREYADYHMVRDSGQKDLQSMDTTLIQSSCG